MGKRFTMTAEGLSGENIYIQTRPGSLIPIIQTSFYSAASFTLAEGDTHVQNI
jgi:hypothetical protein